MALYALILFYAVFPIVVIYLCYRSNFFNKIGAVVICYLAGIILGNIGILPENIIKVQETTAGITVALALPLLLFSMDVKQWSRLAGKTIVSMVIATTVIVIISFIGFIFIIKWIPDAWKVAGMAVGVYTGGTPNLAAIKAALNIDATTFIIVHTYDMAASIVYLIFCITIAQRIFIKFLTPFERTDLSEKMNESDNGFIQEDIHSYEGFFSRKTIIPLTGAMLLSLLIVAFSDQISKLVPKNFATSVMILSITTLGISLSFIKKIRNIEKSFQLGMYFIYIFCLIVGSMANFKMIITINFPIMFFITFCIFASMFFHALFCKIFRVDADTFIITSVSAICSPPFVPVVADALNNRMIILSGLTTGIIGYAIGNYLGISVAYLIRLLF